MTGAHSIWELVTHVNWWLDAVTRRIGGEAVEAVDDEDWPATPAPTAAAWTLALKGLQANHERLTATVRRLS
jgi:hypothetical protein